MSKKNGKKRLGLVLLVLFFAGFGLWNMEMPRMVGLFSKNRMLRIASAGQTLSTAMIAAANDPQVGLPADCGIRSTGEYLELLVNKGFLKRDDLALFAGFILGNVSRNDSDRASLLISRPYYEYITQGARFPQDSITIRKNGEAETLPAPLPISDFPPRTPPFLTP